MNRQLHREQEQINSLLQNTEDRSAAFLPRLNDLPVTRVTVAADNLQLPVERAGAKVAELFRQRYEALPAGNAVPRYRGAATGGSKPAAITAGWLMA